MKSASEGHNEDGDDLLEVSVCSFSPRSEFSPWHRPTCGRTRPFRSSTMTRLVTRLVIIIFSLASVLTLPESLTPAPSSDPYEDEEPPLGQSHVTSQLDALRVPSTSQTRPEGNLETVESPWGRSIFKKWRQRMDIKDLGLHKPVRLSRKSREPANRRSPSHSPPRVDATNEGPPRMAAGRRRAVSALP